MAVPGNGATLRPPYMLCITTLSSYSRVSSPVPCGCTIVNLGPARPYLICCPTVRYWSIPMSFKSLSSTQ